MKSLLGHAIGLLSIFVFDFWFKFSLFLCKCITYFFLLAGGTAGAMSKITGTFGQAFASLSFDQDYRMVGTC